MTITDIEAIDKIMLTAADVAPLLGFDANSIRMQARKEPDLLGFPVVVVAGTRVQIPKEGFLHFMRFGRTMIFNPSEKLKYDMGS